MANPDIKALKKSSDSHKTAENTNFILVVPRHKLVLPHRHVRCLLPPCARFFRYYLLCRQNKATKEKKLNAEMAATSRPIKKRHLGAYNCNNMYEAAIWGDL